MKFFQLLPQPWPVRRLFIDPLPLIHPRQGIPDHVSPGGLCVLGSLARSIQGFDRFRLLSKTEGLLRHGGIIPRGFFPLLRHRRHRRSQARGRILRWHGLGGHCAHGPDRPQANKANRAPPSHAWTLAFFSLETSFVLFFMTGGKDASPWVTAPMATRRRLGSTGISRARLSAKRNTAGARAH